MSDSGKATSPLLRQLDVDIPSSVSDIIPPMETRVPQRNSLHRNQSGDGE